MLRLSPRYLKPGTGQVECVEIDWKPRSCPELPEPGGKDIRQWWRVLKAASQKAGCPMKCPKMEELLHKAGFVSIRSRTFRIPFQASYARDDWWADWLHAAMVGTRNPDEGDNGFVNLSLSHITRQLGWSARAVRELCGAVGTEAIQEIDNPLHFNLHVWTARKPESLAYEPEFDLWAYA